jgi:hypothetical protein
VTPFHLLLTLSSNLFSKIMFAIPALLQTLLPPRILSFSTSTLSPFAYVSSVGIYVSTQVTLRRFLDILFHFMIKVQTKSSTKWNGISARFLKQVSWRDGNFKMSLPISYTFQERNLNILLPRTLQLLLLVLLLLCICNDTPTLIRQWIIHFAAKLHDLQI